jgi:predicted lipoprotein
VGVSRTRIIMLKGRGKIMAIGTNGVSVALDPEKSEPEIVLQTGLLFGNTVRDATGLIEASHFANSQLFNEVSTELNRIVETRVMPTLKEPTASFNQNVEFVGCADIQNYARVELPLRIIPLSVRMGTVRETPLLSDGPHVR